MRVLLVEDTVAVRDALGAALRAHGYRVDTVGTGAAALEAVTADRGGGGGGPDLVLLDLGLPDAAGLDAVTRMRGIAPALAIIVVTGLDDDARRAQALAAGAQDYIVKGSVDGDELAERIAAAIERRRREYAADG